jgi:hypothetical protein
MSITVKLLLVIDASRSGTRSSYLIKEPRWWMPASKVRDYVNVKVLDNVNAVPAELRDYLNADSLPTRLPSRKRYAKLRDLT